VLYFAKSRSATVGTNTIAQNGDEVGVIGFYAADGANYVPAANILVAVDGTPGTNDMPGRLTFSTTADGASASTERLRITSSGNVGIGTTAVDAPLHVAAANGAPLIKGVASTGTNACYMQLGNTAGGVIVGRDNSTGGILGGGAYATHLWAQGAYPLVFSTNSTQRAQIDSSGRLLVGTSSGFYSTTVKLQGNNASSTDESRIRLCRGTASPANGDTLAILGFSDNTETPSAEIAAQRDGGTWSASSVPGRLTFSTTADGASSPTERMRITNGGDFYFNCTVTTKTTEGFRVENGGQPTVSRGIAGSFMLFFHAGDGSTIGSITNSGGTATAYNTSSDYRLKENVNPVSDGITRLQQLKPSRFNFIADPAKTVDGFLAHEVQTIVPEAITGEKDAVDDEGNPQYQGIDQSKLVPLLTAALQEAIAKIETLEGMVAVNNITIDEQQHQLSTLAARVVPFTTMSDDDLVRTA
jgi:hypothetical protein